MNKVDHYPGIGDIIESTLGSDAVLEDIYDCDRDYDPFEIPGLHLQYCGSKYNRKIFNKFSGAYVDYYDSVSRVIDLCIWSHNPR